MLTLSDQWKQHSNSYVIKRQKRNLSFLSEELSSNRLIVFSINPNLSKWRRVELSHFWTDLTVLCRKVNLFENTVYQLMNSVMGVVKVCVWLLTTFSFLCRRLLHIFLIGSWFLRRFRLQNCLLLTQCSPGRHQQNPIQLPWEHANVPTCKHVACATLLTWHC